MKTKLFNFIPVFSVLLQPLVGLEVRDGAANHPEASLWSFYPTPIVQLIEQPEALESPDFQIEAEDSVREISFIQPMAIQDVVHNFLETLQANPQTGGHPWEQRPLS